jgi:hypothetical protein
MLQFKYYIKIKNIVAKLKNQNGGLIQDADENIFFIFHIISRRFDFLTWQQCFYFYIVL